jgi:hypothetical protein
VFNVRPQSNKPVWNQEVFSGDQLCLCETKAGYETSVLPCTDTTHHWKRILHKYLLWNVWFYTEWYLQHIAGKGQTIISNILQCDEIYSISSTNFHNRMWIWDTAYCKKTFNLKIWSKWALEKQWFPLHGVVLSQHKDFIFTYTFTDWFQNEWSSAISIPFLWFCNQA